jgi:hypothetical protein
MKKRDEFWIADFGLKEITKLKIRNSKSNKFSLSGVNRSFTLGLRERD